MLKHHREDEVHASPHPLSKERLRILRSLDSRKVRRRRGLCLVEGERAIAEALRAGALQWLVVEEGREAPGLVAPGGATAAFTLEPALFSQVADVAQSSGALGVARIPSWSADDLPAAGAPTLLLYLDGLQDPGNVGALVRSAWALGAGGVLLAPGTADPFGPKAVRASAGGVFRVPVLEGWDVPALSSLLGKGYALFIADSRGRDHLEADYPARCILALGNEAAGPSPALAALGEAVSVPMAAGADSLNVVVAGSIVAADMARRIRRL